MTAPMTQEALFLIQSSSALRRLCEALGERPGLDLHVDEIGVVRLTFALRQRSRTMNVGLAKFGIPSSASIQAASSGRAAARP